MECPACECNFSENDIIKKDDIRAVHCSCCKGLWVFGNGGTESTNKYEKLIVSLSNRIETKPTLRYCTQCSTPMHRAFVELVEIEICKGCKGAFFDFGEFEKIKRILKTDSSEPGGTRRERVTSESHRKRSKAGYKSSRKHRSEGDFQYDTSRFDGIGIIFEALGFFFLDF